MKKIILFIALLFLSCSKEDAKEQSETNDYVTISYTDECYNSSIGFFCATRSNYDNATIWFLDETGCYKIGLQDIDGNFRIEIFSYAMLHGGCYN